MVKLLALTLGDRYGVGPELVARLLDGLSLDPDTRVIVVGDRAVFERGRRDVGLGGDIPAVTSLAAAQRANSSWVFLHRPFEAEVTPVGRVSEGAGSEVLDTLGFLVDAIKAGEIGGIVYAPLNKQAMRMAGHAAGDELEFFNARFGGGGGEVNILGDVWTSRVTSHVPLRAVGDLITPRKVMRGITLLDNALKKSGLKRPRLALAAINPHAGEGGAFGMEEIEVLIPTVAEAKKGGLDVEGPFPSDTVFPRAVAGNFDGVVTMFHDQGQIALKMIGLGQGITLLAGLPVPIATPGHGTAFDIAGTGKARVDGLASATQLVARMMQS